MQLKHTPEATERLQVGAREHFGAPGLATILDSASQVCLTLRSGAGLGNALCFTAGTDTQIFNFVLRSLLCEPIRYVPNCRCKPCDET